MNYTDFTQQCILKVADGKPLPQPVELFSDLALIGAIVADASPETLRIIESPISHILYGGDAPLSDQDLHAVHACAIRVLSLLIGLALEARPL